MKSRKLLLSLAVFFLVGAFAPAKATPFVEGEGEEGTEPTITGWHQIGPNNVAGRVRTLMFDKFNDDVIYACSPSGGLFVSVNDGNISQMCVFAEDEELAVEEPLKAIDVMKTESFMLEQEKAFILNQKLVKNISKQV